MTALMALVVLALPPADSLLGVDPQGNPIYSASGAIFIADLEAETVIRRIALPRAPRSISAVAGGRWIATAEARSVTVIDVQTGTLDAIPAEDVERVAIAPDGRSLAIQRVPSGKNWRQRKADATLALLDLPGGELRWQANGTRAYRMALSTKGRLAWLDHRVARVRDGWHVEQLANDAASVQLDHTGDGFIVAGTKTFWTAAGGVISAPDLPSSADLYALDARQFVAIGHAANPQPVSLHRADGVRMIEGPRAQEGFPDGRGGVLIQSGARILRWRPNDSAPAVVQSAHAGPVAALVAAQDHVVSAGEDGQLGVWHAPTGAMDVRLKLHDGPITHLTVPACNAPLTIISAGEDGRVWAIALTPPIIPRPLGRMNGPISFLVGAPDCHVGVVDDASIQVFDVRMRRRVEHLHPESPVLSVDTRQDGLNFNLTPTPSGGPTLITRLPRRVEWTPDATHVVPTSWQATARHSGAARSNAWARQRSVHIDARTPAIVFAASEPTMRLPGATLTAAVGKPGKWTVAGTADGRLAFWESWPMTTAVFHPHNASFHGADRVQTNSLDPLAFDTHTGRPVPAVNGILAPDGEHFVQLRSRRRVQPIAIVTPDGSTQPLDLPQQHSQQFVWLNASTVLTRTAGALLALGLDGQLAQQWPVPNAPHARQRIVRLSETRVLGLGKDEIWVLDPATGAMARWPMVSKEAGYFVALHPSPSQDVVVIEHLRAALVVDTQTGAVRSTIPLSDRMRVAGMLDDETLVTYDQFLYVLSLPDAARLADAPFSAVATRLLTAIKRAEVSPNGRHLLAVQADCTVVLDASGRMLWRRHVNGGACASR